MITSVISLIICVLELITAWKVFEKYGEPGWKGIVPFYSDWVEYGKVWSAPAAIIYIVCLIISWISNIAGDDASSALTAIAAIAGVVSFIVNIIFANKKSKAFGKGLGMTLLLIFFPFIGNLIIGFGSAQYQGEKRL